MQQVTSNNQLLLAWGMFFLFGIFRYQPDMGMEKNAWKTEEFLFSSIHISSKALHARVNVQHLYLYQISDMNIFWTGASSTVVSAPALVPQALGSNPVSSPIHETCLSSLPVWQFDYKKEENTTPGAQFQPATFYLCC
jgi:hypothetical protein